MGIASNGIASRNDALAYGRAACPLTLGPYHATR